jgi:hypothetical protein
MKIEKKKKKGKEIIETMTRQDVEPLRNCLIPAFYFLIRTMVSFNFTVAASYHCHR